MTGYPPILRSPFSGDYLRAFQVHSILDPTSELTTSSVQVPLARFNKSCTAVIGIDAVALDRNNFAEFAEQTEQVLGKTRDSIVVDGWQVQDVPYISDANLTGSIYFPAGQIPLYHLRLSRLKKLFIAKIFDGDHELYERDEIISTIQSNAAATAQSHLIPPEESIFIGGSRLLKLRDHYKLPRSDIFDFAEILSNRLYLEPTKPGWNEEAQCMQMNSYSSSSSLEMSACLEHDDQCETLELEFVADGSLNAHQVDELRRLARLLPSITGLVPQGRLQDPHHEAAYQERVRELNPKWF